MASGDTIEISVKEIREGRYKVLITRKKPGDKMKTVLNAVVDTVHIELPQGRLTY